VAKAALFAAMTGVALASALASAELVVRLSDNGTALLRAAAVGAPAAPPTLADAVLKGADGHYWAEGEIEGERVRFLVDTGATQVALTADDARRLGIDLSRLRYNSSVVTAAGRTRAAVVRLPAITVAGARIEQVDAVVIEKGLDASLLGMSYLGRLSSFEATPEALFLRP